MNIIPVFLGADLNCYNMARAFHEQYGVVSYAFGKYAIGATKYSKIIKFTAVEHLDNDAVMIDTVNSFAKKHPGKTLSLLGCTDDYAAMIIKNRALISSDYITSCPSVELYEKLLRKADFYDICTKYDIPFPNTKVISAAFDAGDFSEASLGFAYPIIVKPSNSVDYWKNPFVGMKKVYIAKSEDHARNIASEIFASGYGDKIILQEFIDGDDSHMRVLTAYSDANGKVKMMCLGHVLLEEHTPKGLGNHAAIITEYEPELCEKFKAFLEDIGYTGFSNFDLKFDARDNVFRAFEINLRQGRSNFYVTGAGINMAKLVVEGSQGGETVVCKNAHYWHAIPNRVVQKYVADEALKAMVKQLISEGKESSSFRYKYDLRFNLLRSIFVFENNRRHYKKYKTYYPVKKK
jgi:Predicted ATP-grasp enzyme